MTQASPTPPLTYEHPRLFCDAARAQPRTELLKRLALSNLIPYSALDKNGKDGLTQERVLSGILELLAEAGHWQAAVSPASVALLLQNDRPFLAFTEVTRVMALFVGAQLLAQDAAGDYYGGPKLQAFCTCYRQDFVNGLAHHRGEAALYPFAAQAQAAAPTQAQSPATRSV